MSLIKNIKLIRKKHNLTQKQLADLLDFSRQAINQIESGMKFPSYKFFYNIATKLNINLNWLILNIGNMELSEYEKTIQLEEKIQFLEKEVQVYREILEMNQLIKNKKKK